MLLSRLFLSLLTFFPAVTFAWEEQHVLDIILASSPILRAYRVVTSEYTPSTPMQRVLEHTSVFARAAPSEIGSTQATSDGNFLSSSGNTVGLPLSIPLTSRKKEREHALKALDEIKAIEELRAAVLQDLGVLRQHEADHQATQQRIALYQDKSGWAQERVSTGYDDVAGLWDIAQRLNEEKAGLSKLGLEIASHQHRVAAYAGESWPELLAYLREGEDLKKQTKQNNPVAQIQKPRLPDLNTP